jgi:hypothetical protein
MIKSALRLGKLSNHSNIASAMSVRSTGRTIMEKTYWKIFETEPPVMILCISMLIKYITNCNVIKGTMIDRLMKAGLTPLPTALKTISTQRITG